MIFGKFLKSHSERNKPDTNIDSEEVLRIEARSGNVRQGAINEFSDTWVFVANWAEAELQRARERNDSLKRDATQTAALRGKIELLKDLLNLPHPKERRVRSSEQDD